MRLWTIQGIEIYEMLQRDGYAYCTKPSWGDDEKFMYAYHWMARQMKQRIGEPPIAAIEYPIWAWYQYHSAKRKKPSRSWKDIQEGISAYMEIEIPDKDVLLSDFSAWHHPLNQWCLDNWRTIDKKTDLLEKETGRRFDFQDYPIEIQEEIVKSWDAVFDINRRDKEVMGRTHKKNRSIQATFWMLRPEYVQSVEFLERSGNNVTIIKNKSLYFTS